MHTRAALWSVVLHAGRSSVLPLATAEVACHVVYPPPWHASVAQSQLDNLRFYWKDIDKAFCPLGRDGRPMRKYSERKQSHWFHGDHRGMSQVDTVEVLQTQKNSKSQSPERAVSGQLTANGNDCVTEDIAQDGRMRRTTFNTSSVEKQVVKGSINKVVTQSAGLKVSTLK
ncbi:hypothetical protein SCLCIDRAFT_20755 [Scleroderma citrinum Foug A]|uniref:Secreted protein n=1 Tax=Scleroderma citrinum Foug A TaxID=1036808 RepID=A0A0C3EII6_9AGAM|nr:hypothetical protein SCLCIDRAFT_20755 [Scleroderma citrinum Foug A]